MRSVFYYVQLLHACLSKAERSKRVWDLGYTLVYQDCAALSNQVGGGGSVDGWTGGWTGGRVDAWIDGWMGGWVDGWWMGGWVGG